MDPIFPALRHAVDEVEAGLHATDRTAPRYAVYLAPSPDSALWRFGSGVLGYDAVTGAELAFPALAGFDVAAWQALTEAPRRYGFHGTLKPPFRLASGIGERELCAAVAALAARIHAFELPPLAVNVIGSFVALTASVHPPALNTLAAHLVRECESLCAPVSADDLARRDSGHLSRRQLGYLARYGYPYVMEEFRFHMTLSGPLDPYLRVHVRNALADAFASARAHLPFVVRDLAVFRQDTPQTRFRLIARAPLHPA